jgi:hypothetical protein
MTATTACETEICLECLDGKIWVQRDYENAMSIEWIDCSACGGTGWQLRKEGNAPIPEQPNQRL